MESKPVAAAKALGATVAMALGGLILPFIGPFILASSGAPIAMLVYRHGQWAGVAVALVLGLIAVILGNLGAGAVVFGVFIGVGVMIGLSLKEGHPFHATVTAASLLVTAVLLTAGLLSWRLAGVDLYAEAVIALRAALDQVSTAYLAMGADAQTVAAFKEVISQTRAALPTFLPGMILMSVVSAAAFSAGAAQILLARKEPLAPRLQSFRLWRMPWPWAWAFGLGLAALLLEGYVEATGALELALLGFGRSVLLVFGTLYFIQGLAVGYFYLARWRTAVVWVVLIAVLVVFIPFLSQVALLFGLMDTWFDFRRLQTAAGTPGEVDGKGSVIDEVIGDEQETKEKSAENQREDETDGGR